MQLPGDETDELRRSLRTAGLVQLRGWAKHAARVRELEPAEGEVRSDLQVERITPDRASEWAAILRPAFEFPLGSEEWLAATVGREGWHHYLALEGETPAACAALYVDGGIGTLGFAATRASHRRRGAQSALIARRMADARRLGLEWVVTETDDELPDRPNPSYHNIVRHGLPVVYVRANWGPEPPGSSGPA